MAASVDNTRKIVTNAVAAAGALTGLVVALTELRDKTAALLGVREQWIGVCGIVLTLGFVWAFWLGPPVARWWRARNLVPKLKPGGFRLHPYDSSDRGAFARDDKEHERILKWIRSAADPLLYLAGASGSGKSSLLHAFVLPGLVDNDKHVCIAVRGVQEPLQQIRRSLLRPDAVWQNPNDDAEESTVALAKRAAERLSRSNRRLYFVFDQFEELLILHERSSPEVTGVLEFIKAVTDGEPGSAPTVLLVMRSDYEGRVRELGLPSERMGVNKEVVRLVSEPDAEAFLERGGLRDVAIRRRLVREASDLEETKGRLRFITLNFLGLAAFEVPGRVRGGRTGRGLLRGAVRAWLTEPAVREQADAVLRPLISEEETKKPLALTEIVQVSELPEREVARVLMQFERDGLVRRHQNDTEIWEISHDFVARLLQRVLDELRASLLARARPWLGTAAGVAILLALVGVGAAMYVRYDRVLLSWQIAEGRVVNIEGTRNVRRVEFQNGGAVTDFTLRYLAYLPERRSVTVLDLTHLSITDAGLTQLARADTGLEALTTLDLRYTRVTDAGLTQLARADTGLKALTTLHLEGTRVTDEGLTQLARADSGLKALTTLVLRNTQVTDAGLAQLARADSGLKSLTTLHLDYTPVTDAGLAELARADSGLKALTMLFLTRTQVTDAGLAQLARADSGLKALTTLDLSRTQVTAAGLAQLARADSGLKALTTLNLWNTQVTDAGLAELARADSGLKALTTLNLWNTQVTDAGLAQLARAESGLKALTTLDLNGTDVTDAGLAALAAKDSGLKALTTLSLKGTRVTDAGVAALAAPDSGLKALTTLHPGNTLVTDAGLAQLARAESGLKALTTLDLNYAQVTDAGLAQLARPDSGLKALTTLNLVGTEVTDKGAAALAAPDSGLKALTTLHLGSTPVTDEGLAHLAREESGLKALTTLDLSGTNVTDAGLAALAAKDSGLKALTTLDLRRTRVTDKGAAALVASDSGLKALTTLDLAITQVTNAGVREVTKARPNLTIFH